MFAKSTLDNALINSFSRLVARGIKKIEEVPEEYREKVNELSKNIEVKLREGEFEQPPNVYKP